MSKVRTQTLSPLDIFLIPISQINGEIPIHLSPEMAQELFRNKYSLSLSDHEDEYKFYTFSKADSCEQSITMFGFAYHKGDIPCVAIIIESVKQSDDSIDKATVEELLEVSERYITDNYDNISYGRLDQ